MNKRPFVIFVIFICCQSAYSQQYSINSNIDFIVLNVPVSEELLDNDYDYNSLIEGIPSQFVLGYSRYLNPNLTFGINASIFNTGFSYGFSDLPNYTSGSRSYSMYFTGLGFETKNVFPFWKRVFYTKLNLSYYRLVHSRKRTRINSINTTPIDTVIKITNDRVNKNVLNSFAEMGVQFPLLVRVKPIRVEGSIGLRLYQNYISVIEYENSIFISPGIHFGITVIKL